MLFIALLLQTMQSVAAPSTALPADSVCGSAATFVGPCSHFRGRISLANGGYPLKIWPVGTQRLLAIDLDRCQLPGNVQRLVGELKDIYADLTVRPLTKPVPGVMQKVCLATATKVRTRPAALLTSTR
jgi:hypothetical protein